MTTRGMDDNKPLLDEGFDDDEGETPSIYDQYREGGIHHPTRSVGMPTTQVQTRAIGVSTTEPTVERIQEDVPIDRAINLGRSREIVTSDPLGLEVCDEKTIKICRSMALLILKI